MLNVRIMIDIYTLFLQSSDVVAVGNFDPLDNLIDTADAHASGDFDEDETLVAPPGAPRVLHLPVVVVVIIL